MLTADLTLASWKPTIWLPSFLHSPLGAATLNAFAITALIQGVRSAWVDIYSRWYRR